MQIGKRVAESLGEAGFKVERDGTITTRICLPAIDWKKRAA